MDGITESNRQTLNALKARKRPLDPPISTFLNPAVVLPLDVGQGQERAEGTASTIKVEDQEKRKEQLRIAKLIIEFNKEEPQDQEVKTEKRQKGRPPVPKELQSRNVTLSLSRDEIDLLDNLANLKGGRGNRVVSLMNYYIKIENRQKEQVKSIKETLRIVDSYFDTLSRNGFRAEKFRENEESIKGLDGAIERFKIVLNLLKIDSSDLKKLLLPKEFKTYEFALSYSYNKQARAQE